MNNISLIGSFAIGGVILLSLLTLSANFSGKSQSTMMSEIAQTHATEFGRVIEYDFNKIGYRVTTGSKILSADTSSINFVADLNNDGTIDSVSYYTATTNTGIKILRHCSLYQTSDYSINAANFNITGYDSTGATTTSIPLFHSIMVTIVLDENYPLMEETDQIGVFWRRRFFPKNL